MKIRLPSRNGRHGKVLVITLIIAVLIGLVVAAQITLISSQNSFNMRSQTWAAEIPIAEAGIEEALAHINSKPASLATNGWSLVTNNYVKTRTLTNGNYFYVAISTVSPPTIVSVGYGRIPGQTNYSHRTIMVTTSVSGTGTGKGVIGRTGINLGADIRIDSYDSTDPNYSTFGLFDTNKTKSGGDVAVLTNLAGALDVAGSKIWGHASTPPGGVIAIGGDGVIGEKAWSDAGNRGIEPGWSSEDATLTLTNVATPSGASSWSAPGGSQTIGGVTYAYVLTSGNYSMGTTTLKGKVYVSGSANLYIPSGGRIQFGSSDVIKIIPGASLNFYNASTTDAVFTGVSNDSGIPKNFTYLGLPTTVGSKASFTGGGQFAGTVYAPNQKLVLTGGSSTDQDFLGSIVGNYVTASGHFYLHYDESLGGASSGPGIVKVASWEEL